MSWDVEIQDKQGNIMKCQSPHMLRGGIVQAEVIGSEFVNGQERPKLGQKPITDAELNVTYNYYKQYEPILGDGMKFFQDMSTEDAIPHLEKVVDTLGTKVNPDYWASTPGNAGAAAESLLFLCKECPGGIIKVS